MTIICFYSFNNDKANSKWFIYLTNSIGNPAVCKKVPFLPMYHTAALNGKFPCSESTNFIQMMGREWMHRRLWSFYKKDNLQIRYVLRILFCILLSRRTLRGCAVPCRDTICYIVLHPGFLRVHNVDKYNKMVLVNVNYIVYNTPII